MKKFSILFTCFYITIQAMMSQPDTIRLWQGDAPGALGSEVSDIPVLICYPIKHQQAGPAILICPGGGYGGLAMDHEGHQIAEWYNKRGVSAYILKYRVNRWDLKKYAYPAAFNDASRAMRTIRYHANEWNIDTAKVGIMGFSAGGHLTSTIGTLFDTENRDLSNPIDRLSARPSFMVLCYPVITMTADYNHGGSRRNLLGENPDPALLELMSTEKQVKTNTPPTFIFQTDDDTGVPAENSIAFYLALRKAKVPAEIHIFKPGKHGVGLAQKDPILSVWPSLLENWLKDKI